MFLYQTGVVGHSVNVFSVASRYLLGQGRMLALLGVLLAIGLGGPYALAEGEQVNINTASAEVLSDMLSGVGLAKAHRIVEYREAHGPFEAAEELVEVRGIGDAILNRNKERIVLE